MTFSVIVMHNYFNIVIMKQTKLILQMKWHLKCIYTHGQTSSALYNVYVCVRDRVHVNVPLTGWQVGSGAMHGALGLAPQAEAEYTVSQTINYYALFCTCVMFSRWQRCALLFVGHRSALFPWLAAWNSGAATSSKLLCGEDGTKLWARTNTRWHTHMHTCTQFCSCGTLWNTLLEMSLI